MSPQACDDIEVETLLGYINNLKTAIFEESQDRSRLIPFLDKLVAAVEAKKYTDALCLTDELEEFMDLEFID